MSGFKFVRIALRAGAFASWMVSQSVLAQSMDNMPMAPPDKQQQTSKQKTTQPQPEQKQEEMKMPGMSEQGTEPNAKSPELKPEQPAQKKPEPGKPEEKKPDEKMQHEMSMPEKQDHQAMKAQGPDMQMPGDGDMHMVPESFIAAIEHHGTSGTSAEPNSTPIPMFMKMRGKWMFMFHGAAWINMEQQSSPRGYDKVFSTNWFMPMAQRKIGDQGTLTLRTMLSLEPATVTGRQYPLLFQIGETADNKVIVDGQHPHDFFMELAALYDHRVGRNTLLSFYFAPMGDPAMGPTAYPHRASASENPMATLGHHFQDSTHIAADVITVGLTHKIFRIEASGFHGREPDEQRWNLNSGKIDSWSSRLTVNPAQNWSFQYSFANLVSPEGQHPAEDLRRMTSSLMYNRPFHDGNFAGTVLWGRNQTPEGEVFNGYLAEGTLQFARRNYAWTRFEMDDRTNELVLGKNTPVNLQEHFIGRVKAFTLGYDREFAVIPHVATAFGGQVSVYGTPERVQAIYGAHPTGVVVFVRFRPAVQREKMKM